MKQLLLALGFVAAMAVPAMADDCEPTVGNPCPCEPTVGNNCTVGGN